MKESTRYPMSRVYRPGKPKTGGGAPRRDAARKNVGYSDGCPDESTFPIQCLPGPAVEMAEGICKLERVPESLSGCCVLGILSASIGAGIHVQSGPQRTTRGNLYILASAESGTGKSETFRHAGQPFLDFERQQLERWRTESFPQLQAEEEMLDIEIARLRKERANGRGEREETRRHFEEKKAALLKCESEMQPPVLSVEDITVEKMAALLAQRGECLASLSADGGSIVNNLLGRYNKLDRTDENVYLKAFSGDYCRVDRIGRDPVVLNNPCLATLWLVQPDKLETLMRERSLTDGGLIPRILGCHTNCQPKPIVEGVLPIPENIIAAYRQLVWNLLENYRLGAKTVTVKPTQEALKAMNEHNNRIVERRRNELSDVSSYAARWTEHAWRISVVLHAALWPTDVTTHELELETSQRAITLADWFAEQQLGILATGREAARRAVLEEVLCLLADTPGGITARDVHRKRITKTADEALQLLERLEGEVQLTGKDSMPKGGGHVTRTYRKARK